MKNAIILFLVVLPILLLNDLVFERESPILSALELVLPFVTMSYLLRRSKSEFDQKNIFKEVFKMYLMAGIFYSIWFGSYQYLLTQFIKPEIWEAQMEAIKSTAIMGRTLTDEEILVQSQFSKGPLYWIFSALFVYSLLFSLIGVIFGYLYKSKANI